MGVTSHHFAVFCWLKASPRSHPHSRGGNDTRLKVSRGRSGRGHLWMLPSHIHFAVVGLTAYTIIPSVFCLFCLCVYVYVGKNVSSHVLSLSFSNFSYDIISIPFPLPVVFTYSSVSVIFLRLWHLELTTLPLADQCKYYGTVAFFYLGTVILKLSWFSLESVHIFLLLLNMKSPELHFYRKKVLLIQVFPM